MRLTGLIAGPLRELLKALKLDGDVEVQSESTRGLVAVRRNDAADDDHTLLLDLSSVGHDVRGIVALLFVSYVHSVLGGEDVSEKTVWAEYAGKLRAVHGAMPPAGAGCVMTSPRFVRHTFYAAPATNGPSSFYLATMAALWMSVPDSKLPAAVNDALQAWRAELTEGKADVVGFATGVGNLRAQVADEVAGAAEDSDIAVQYNQATQQAKPLPDSAIARHLVWLEAELRKKPPVKPSFSERLADVAAHIKTPGVPATALECAALRALLARRSVRLHAATDAPGHWDAFELKHDPAAELTAPAILWVAPNAAGTEYQRVSLDYTCSGTPPTAVTASFMAASALDEAVRMLKVAGGGTLRVRLEPVP